MILLEQGSSPLTRGAHSPCKGLDAKSEDHPRSRGEHYVLWILFLRIGGSSPLTRGALFSFLSYLIYRRIIPAHAGSTNHGIGLFFFDKDHPRSRGEHLSVIPFAWLTLGSSPLTRGAQTKQLLQHN